MTNALSSTGTVFTIEHDAEFEGPSHSSSFEELRVQRVHPGHLKAKMTIGMNRLLELIRKAFVGVEELEADRGVAYPEVGRVENKKKRRCIIHRRPGKGKTRETRSSRRRCSSAAGDNHVGWQVPTAVVDASSESTDGAP